MEQVPEKGRPVGNMLLITGYVFALIGGVIGLIIGINIWRSNVLVAGKKSYTFDEQSRRHGKIMVIISILVMFIVILLRLAGA